jgi:hypothetical protein
MRSGSELIAMMQTAEARQGYDVVSRARAVLRRSVPRRFFCQSEMSPVLVIIADVVIHEAFQMVFVEYDE